MRSLRRVRALRLHKDGPACSALVAVAGPRALLSTAFRVFPHPRKAGQRLAGMRPGRREQDGSRT